MNFFEIITQMDKHFPQTINRVQKIIEIANAKTSEIKSKPEVKEIISAVERSVEFVKELLEEKTTKRIRRKQHQALLEKIRSSNDDTCLQMADRRRSIQAVLLALRYGRYISSLEAIQIAVKYGQFNFCKLELEMWAEIPSIPIDHYYKAVEYAIYFSRYRLLRLFFSQHCLDFEHLFQHARQYYQKLNRSGHYCHRKIQNYLR